MISYIKLLLLVLLDLLFRSKKFVQFIFTGKHEVERICCSASDTYDRTMKLEQWLDRTTCRPIRLFFKQEFNKNPKTSTINILVNQFLSTYGRNEPRNKNSSLDFDTIDSSLNPNVIRLTRRLFNIIQQHKSPRLTGDQEDCLWGSLFRILSYKVTIMFADELAKTKYDSNLDAHKLKLRSLWNHLIRADNEHSDDSKAFPSEFAHEIDGESNMVSGRWSHIGFQGEDPGTDFRGMGLLGLIQLEYLSKKPKKLARDLLKRSLTETSGYPFAIVGINITYHLLHLYRDGYIKHLYYDTGDISFKNPQYTLKAFKILNDLYVELFLRFDCFWHDSKPETILEFKGLMEKFVSVVKFDLCNRNFSLKFIY